MFLATPATWRQMLTGLYVSINFFTWIDFSGLVLPITLCYLFPYKLQNRFESLFLFLLIKCSTVIRP